MASTHHSAYSVVQLMPVLKEHLTSQELVEALRQAS